MRNVKSYYQDKSVNYGWERRTAYIILDVLFGHAEASFLIASFQHHGQDILLFHGVNLSVFQDCASGQHHGDLNYGEANDLLSLTSVSMTFLSSSYFALDARMKGLTIPGRLDRKPHSYRKSAIETANG